MSVQARTLVEAGTGDRALGSPHVPYTQRLLVSLRVPDLVEQAERRRALAAIRAAERWA